MLNIASRSFRIAKAEFKLRNEGSYLGIFWYLLNPLLMFILLMAVFSNRLGQKISIYHLYLLVGIIMFNFFQQVTNEAARILNDNRCIIKSISFPYLILIYAVILKSLFSHCFEILLLAAFFIFFKISLSALFFYPVILVFFCMFTAGCSFLLSSLAIHFSDLENIWMFACRILWFITPIFYAIEGQDRLFVLNLFNPLFFFITISRDLMIYNRIPPIWMISGMVGYSVLFLTAGIIIFNRLKRRFTELV